ncbi:unnamed protein product [Prorocentrum cordatum]|uniref:Reverse transcriptase domain-containing protein n=1 Tax=Prorocentrum cordatum TaxID=2364126 RepID=A0ABN9YJG7_9DINO|nr:unnamed protein product [Polarella glacialis]
MAAVATSRWVYVFYAGEVVWRQHLNLVRVALSEADHVIYTAESDLYIVALDNNADVQAARFGAFNPPPPGIAGNQVYGFRAEPTDAELAQLTLEAEQIATAECRTRAAAIGNLDLLTNLRPLVAPGGGGAVAPIAPAGPALGLLRGAAALPAGAPGGDPAGVWRAAACEGGYRIGDEVLGHVPTAARVQDRDIHVLPDDQGLFVELVPPAAIETFLRKAVDADARILPIVRDWQGRRDVPWHKMVEMTRQEDFGSDWTLPGPRTAAWAITSTSWQICRLSATEWGVQEHYQLCQQIKAATCQDLLDGTNLISIEMKFRRLQTIEFAHWDKAKDAESKGVGGKMSLEEQAAFSGVSRSTSSVMVSPELIEHVRGDDVHDIGRRRPRDILPLPYPSFKEPLDKASVKELAREALVQLRVAGGAYNVEQSPLGSYDPAVLSLPGASTAPVPLADVRGEGGQAKVEQFVLQSLMDPSEAEARTAFEPRFSLWKKKGGRLRMVAGCRRPNEVFAEPLGARLATGDAFGMLEMAADDSLLTVEGADLKDAFYHLELPEQLRPCFSLRPARAGVLGIKEVGGVAVGASTKLYPRLRVVPMGWSWAMWWCQSVMERVAEAAGCGDDARLRDGRPAPSLDPSCHLEYVDNFVSIGYDAEAVRSAVTRVMTELKRRGLVVTREEHLGDSEGEFAVLGWSITAASFRFVQKCYHQQVPLWSQVRQELMAWDGVAPLLWLIGMSALFGRLVAIASGGAMAGLSACLLVAGPLPLNVPLTGTPKYKVGLDPRGDARNRPAAAASLPPAGASLVRGARKAGLQSPTLPVLQASPASRQGSSGGPTPQQRARLIQPPAGMPVLNAASVRTASGRQAYLSMLAGFDNWTRQHRRATQEPAQMDRAVRDYISHLFERGYHQTYANRMIAAVAWRDPRYARTGQFELPLSKQAAKGWRNLAPARSRMALPCEVVAMVVNYVPHQRGAPEALAIWLLFEIYGRPGEIHGLRLQDVVPPAPSASGAHRYTSVTLHAPEVGDVSKTGEFDAAIRLDLERRAGLAAALLAMAAARRRAGAPPWAPLFAVDQRSVANAWRGAVTALGLRKLGACHVYQLRHSGPSHDYAYAAGLRDLEQIRRRGRWKSWSSVRRCEKGGRLTEQLHKLGGPQREHAEACARLLSRASHGLPSALVPVCPTRQ